MTIKSLLLASLALATIIFSHTTQLSAQKSKIEYFWGHFELASPKMDASLKIWPNGEFQVLMEEQVLSGKWSAKILPGHHTEAQIEFRYTDGKVERYQAINDIKSLRMTSQDGSRFYLFNCVSQFDKTERPKRLSAKTRRTIQTESSTPEKSNQVPRVEGIWYGMITKGALKIAFKAVYDKDEKYRFAFTFKTPDGRQTISESGNWKVKDGILYTISAEDQSTEALPFKLHEKDLLIDARKQLGVVVKLSRHPSRVTPTVVRDWEKLSDYID